MFLVGCATLSSPTVRSIQGACDSFKAPDYAVKGKAALDQEWVDETTESGVAACHWKRPKPRPVAKVAKTKPKKVVSLPTPKPPVIVDAPAVEAQPPAPAPTWWDKIKYWVVH